MTLPQPRTEALNRLFDRWIQTYPESEVGNFHRDGIVNEPNFEAAPRRVLFVVLEPNTRDGLYDHFRGCDLREAFRTTPQKKNFNINLGRWVSVILEDRTAFWRPDEHESRRRIRRVAIINLKKIAGSGAKNVRAVRHHAARDCDLLREQIAIISPNLIITCGADANSILRSIAMPGRPSQSSCHWAWGTSAVILGNHPSLRPKDAENAFDRLVSRLRDSGFSPGGGGTSD